MTNKRMEITRKSFEQIPFWTELTEEEKQLIQRNAFLRRYEKGAFVYGGADECLGMLLLLKGRLRTSLLSDEGREVTLFNLHPGEICVLSASCIISEITFDTGMTAEKVSDILVIPSGTIDCLQSRNIHVKCFLYELAIGRFSDVMWSMQQIMFKRLDQRLARFLVEEYERTGVKNIYITHDQIAVHISSAREAVARMLKRFAEAGLVELKRGEIKLENIDEIKKLL